MWIPKIIFNQKLRYNDESIIWKNKNLKKNKSMKLFRGKGETNKHPHPSNHHYPTTSKKPQKKNAAKVLEYIPSLAPPTAWSYLQAQTEGPRWSPVTMGSEVVVWSTGLPGVTKTKEYVLLFFFGVVCFRNKFRTWWFFVEVWIQEVKFMSSINSL